jgi:hypothetical protein
MAALNAFKLQERLGVARDGKIGAGTLGALFARAGAAPAICDELGLAANVHFRTYGILETPLRLAHFMAQYADADNLLGVSNGINRGNPGSTAEPNGWADRQARYRTIRGLVL